MSAATLPGGFVYLDRVDPTILTSLRYATEENFTGKVVPGYAPDSSRVIVTLRTALILRQIQSVVREKGYSLVIYDAFRPKQAVQAFVEWGNEEGSHTMKSKQEYYPTLTREEIFANRYIAKQSTHSRGSTVDLTLIPLGNVVRSPPQYSNRGTEEDPLPYLDDGTLDMGSSFDLFHIRSHHDVQGDVFITEEHVKRRNALRDVMVSHGFQPTPREWWHYTLKDEPFPTSYFDFPVHDSYSDFLQTIFGDGDEIVLLDGGLASQLEAANFDLRHPLWSAKILGTPDGDEAIILVHENYYKAGARIATTASYQATPQGFAQHFGLSSSESKRLIEHSVLLAKKARERVGDSSLKIAGSVGPYGAFLANGEEFKGTYSLTLEDYIAFHVDRVTWLVYAGIDFVLFETVPKLDEALAMQHLMQTHFPWMPYVISFTAVDGEHISDGTLFHDCVTSLCKGNHNSALLAVGINCTHPQYVASLLQVGKRVLEQQHLQDSQMRLVCYANGGSVWNPSTQLWEDVGVDADKWCQEGLRWKDSGAGIIGGCCQTTPDHIRRLKVILGMSK